MDLVTATYGLGGSYQWSFDLIGKIVNQKNIQIECANKRGEVSYGHRENK